MCRPNSTGRGDLNSIRLNHLRLTFETKTENARTQVIAGRMMGDAFEALRQSAEQEALDGFTKNLRAEAAALNHELHSRLTPEMRIQLAAPYLDLATRPVVTREYQVLFIEMLGKALEARILALPD